MSLSDFTSKELAKAGILFLVMGIIITVFWLNIQGEIEMLRKETKECSESYKDLLLNQLKENTKQLEKNNDLLTFNRRNSYDTNY